ncbi:cytochrome C oxidase subunit IV family protein [Hyalangium versicolor]|uniref:cytochrome C oxidase subunit IV family protein n=1 Tax=Hyalangium versicolor TaxID=2861190 RepID=UPI001CCDBBA9|nr:cytochrome C oxidase subunit IV family protein [Hyalangium versicolor]
MTGTPDRSKGHEPHGGFGKALLVGGGLLAFTTLSYGLAHLHLGHWGLVVAMVIALIKSTLVVFFFMHLSERPGGPRLVVATAMAFVVILVGLILAEASERPRSVLPPGPFSAETLPGLQDEPAAAPTRESPSEQTP